MHRILGCWFFATSLPRITLLQARPIGLERPTLTNPFEPEGEQLGFGIEGMGAAKPFVNSHAVRLELLEILETAQAARETAPWDRETHRRYKEAFPAKAKSLPPEEAEFLRRQFVLELERIERLLAA